MEHVNNDMDDLFRKAGDLYPLRTSESDWDSVMGKLKDENFGNENAVTSISGKPARFKRRWLLLLLLIPAAIGGAVYFSSENKSPANAKAAGLNSTKDKGNISGEIRQGNTGNKPASGSGQSNIAQETTSYVPDLATDKKASGKILGKGHSALSTPALLQSSMTDHSDNTTSSPAADAFSLSSGPFKDAQIKPLSLFPESRIGKINPDFNHLPVKAAQAAAMLKKTNTQGKPGKGFYVGLLTGPDLSTIKFQSVKQLGFSLGLLVGYRFNQKFSLESGLLWDKKYYYTKGEYFDKSKTSMPSTENILNLNGYCNMFEIPLDLRYDFKKAGSNGLFFVKAGVSAYLMKKEMYDINAKNNGMNVSYPATYYNTSNNFLAVMQVSAGYEYAISHKTNIRVEPYLKIPLQKIGIGSMPISSAGFYLGITHSFR